MSFHDELRASLLRARVALSRDQDGAFEQHKQLASAVHRAALLNKRASDESECIVWVRYVREHFPAGLYDEGTAEVLWHEWRTSLLKRDTPGLSISLAQDQPEAHRHPDPKGRLVLNLESLWAEFERSIDHFLDSLRDDPARRKVVEDRAAKQRWAVEVTVLPSASLMDIPLTAANLTTSVAASMTTVRVLKSKPTL